MAASWGILINGLGQSGKLKKGGSTLKMDCSCSKTDFVFDNSKGTDTKKEFIPAKKTYPFFDKQTETYTKNDAINSAELIPLLPKFLQKPK